MKAIIANARQLPPSTFMVPSAGNHCLISSSNTIPVPFSSNADLVFFNKMIVLKKEQLDRAFQVRHDFES